MKIRIEEIAKEAGVSRSTVSRVLQNHPNVKPDTREKVTEVMQQLGYRPNRLARGLVTGKFNFVGLIVGDVRNPFYSEVAHIAEDILNEQGYMVVLCNSDYNIEKEKNYLNMMEDFGFAGVIMTSAAENSELATMLKNMDCPVVLINRYLRNFNSNVVTIDNHLGGYLAVNHLLSLGHRNIAMLAGPEDSSSSRERLEGWKEAFAEYNLPWPGVCYSDLHSKFGYDFGLSLLKMPKNKRPTAVCAVNDAMALGVMQAFTENGLSIPEDLSVIGFDDISPIVQSKIGLTTIRQPQEEMGKVAANMLLDRIKGIESSSKRVIFEPELIVRDSTAAI